LQQERINEAKQLNFIKNLHCLEQAEKYSTLV